MLSAAVIARTSTASTAGLAYHAYSRSLDIGVKPRTRPTRSSRARGFVTRLMPIVRTKHAVHAQTAPQRFCAMSDGYVCHTASFEKRGDVLPATSVTS